LTKPYATPPNSEDADADADADASEKIGSTSHPAKTFLVVSGFCYLILSIVVVQPAAIVLSILPLWLGNRRYSGGGRFLTILWGALTILLAMFNQVAVGVRYPVEILVLVYLMPAIIIAKTITARTRVS